MKCVLFALNHGAVTNYEQQLTDDPCFPRGTNSRKMGFIQRGGVTIMAGAIKKAKNARFELGPRLQITCIRPRVSRNASPFPGRPTTSTPDREQTYLFQHQQRASVSESYRNSLCLSCPERFDRLVSTDGLEIPSSLRDERATRLELLNHSPVIPAWISTAA